MEKLRIENRLEKINLLYETNYCLYYIKYRVNRHHSLRNRKSILCLEQWKKNENVLIIT